MKTLVYQSFRTERVPSWVSACMATVKAWAAAQGFDYRFYDDGFLARAPDWFRQRCGEQLCPVTDLARLVVAKELRAEGWQRTIWMDADMLVFDPAALQITAQSGFALCHELWLYTDATGARRASHRVNNSIAVFCADSLHLDFFIDACVRIGRQREVIGKLDVGTDFLSALRQILPFPLLGNVGMLSPTHITEIAAGKPARVADYMRALPGPLACANLCGSLQGQRIQGVAADEAAFEQAVARLLASRGGVINGLRP
ncbi:hypothetical protein [Pelomonas cellulosilytica]|uniref:Uncharacterized protein n=1 Tax=Pelomonas cellulosilytica TaxID=2906762 RepID=A0ABS8XR88_9BURK|nr:hypothetical protein [Pelomonas sp. P8]MCE4553795.1 hypothetical protein [Pelomonas sp. P8]